MVQSLTWASERDRPQWRRSVFLQVLEVNQGEGQNLTRRKVDPGLTRQGSCVPVNRQDQLTSGSNFSMTSTFSFSTSIPL